MLLNNLNVILLDSSLEFLNLIFHFLEVFEQGLRWFCKIFNELSYLVAEDLVRITTNFSSDWCYGLINIIVIPFGIDWSLYFKYFSENFFHFLLHLALFLTDDSDITVFQKLS